MGWRTGGVDVPFETLLGKTLVSVDGAVGDDVVNFVVSKDETYRLYHNQDCCEYVRVEDIVGDLSDLVGSPILMAEQVDSDDGFDENTREYDDSYTWTFYKLATIKGYVTIRWLGESNGYYSENVDFERVATPNLYDDDEGYPSYTQVTN